MVRERPVRFENFKGGLNFSADEELIPRNATQRAWNVDISTGCLSVSKGYRKYIPERITGGGAIGSLMAFFKNGTGGAEGSLVAASGGSVCYWSGTEWVEIGTGFTSDIFASIVWQRETTEMLILSNGVEAPQKWLGPGKNIENLGGDPPKMTDMALHRERLWCIGDEGNPNRAIYSDDFNPENWVHGEDDAGFNDFLTWDGGVCIGIRNVFDDIVVYKTYNIWRVSGTYPGEYSKNQVFASDGAIAARSIVQSGPMAFHLCSDGIYVYDGVQTAVLGGDIIRPWILDNINAEYAHKACAAVLDGVLYMSIPTGSSTVNNTVLEYDMVHGTFMARDGIEVNQFLVYDRKLLFINSDGYVYEYGEGDDYDGKKIQALYETPWEDLKNRMTVKEIYELHMRLSGHGKIKVTLVTDERERSYVIDCPAQEEVIRKQVYAEGRRFKLRFENVNGSRWTVSKPQLIVEERAV